VLELAQLAKAQGIGFTIDAEESERLELSLDVIGGAFVDKSLDGWEGYGLAVQAYQKRAPFVIDYLADLARQTGRRMPMRLVKGAYWDSEIKKAQMDGLAGYPVFTRKPNTDVSYLACARRMLAATDALYPMFATHNAQTIAAIHHGRRAAPPSSASGMETTCTPRRSAKTITCSPRVRTGRLHLRTWLSPRPPPARKRRELQLRQPITGLALRRPSSSPIRSRPSPVPSKPHPRIPQPLPLRHERRTPWASIRQRQGPARSRQRLPRCFARRAAGAGRAAGGRHRPFTNPADRRETVGQWLAAASQVERRWPMRAAFNDWDHTPAAAREDLEHAADLMEERMPERSRCAKVAGKSLWPGRGSARADFAAHVQPLFAIRSCRDRTVNRTNCSCMAAACSSASARGIFRAILGQAVAALAAGNTVIAAGRADLFDCPFRHQVVAEVGVPENVVQFLPGDGARLARR
jgi:RHH-type proline utilization regulon transcriptional repressor/proline dehydrogenase/delta 1-pyrroline-5-carboxylate dehydrogenase